MRRSAHALVTCGLLANYLLAITLGVCYHSHTQHECTPGELRGAGPVAHDGAAVCGDHRCCHPPTYAGLVWTGDAPSAACRPGNSCPVCQFFSHKPVASRHASAATGKPQREPPPALAVARAQRTPSIYRARAPPA